MNSADLRGAGFVPVCRLPLSQGLTAELWVSQSGELRLVNTETSVVVKSDSFANGCAAQKEEWPYRSISVADVIGEK